MEKVLDFLKYLTSEKCLTLPYISFFSDGSGFISYTEYIDDVQLFGFRDLEELLEKIETYMSN